MSTYNFAVLMASWEQLLAAVETHEAELPVLASFKAPLRDNLDRIRVAKIQQEVLTASRRQATLDVAQRVREGWDLVTRLRNQIKAELGVRDERLTLFGIKPIPAHRG